MRALLLGLVLLTGCTSHCVVVWREGPYRGVPVAYPSCPAFTDGAVLEPLCAVDGQPFRPCSQIGQR